MEQPQLLSNVFQYFVTITGKKKRIIAVPQGLFLQAVLLWLSCYSQGPPQLGEMVWQEPHEVQQGEGLLPGMNNSIHQMGWRQTGNQPCKKGLVDPAGHQVKYKMSSIPL